MSTGGSTDASGRGGLGPEGAGRSSPPSAPAPPSAGTVERWAFDTVVSTDLRRKLHPPPLPDLWEDAPPVRDLREPGRPPLLRALARAPKSLGPNALQHRERRVQQIHTFLHHELQAAELMCWALLRFPDTPVAFRRGLLGICLDEVRHMQMYEQYLHENGAAFGDHPVRDWFWQRVPRSQTPAQFVAVMGIGLEGGNLDHAQRFTERLAAVGDERGAAIQRQVGEEEVAHVRFAAHWFAEFTGGLTFEAWRDALPAPLSPSLMHGEPLNRADRERAGLDAAFLDQLARW